LAVLFLSACSSSSNSDNETSAEESDIFPDENVESVYTEYNNPPAEGFDLEGSDVIATVIADKVMQAMGGRQAWDETRYIKWNFFGARTLLWDKETGNVRIENPGKELTILVNVMDGTGKVQKAGVELTDSVDYYLDMGKRIWINDSYWLVMPFKLKDSGVTLNYLGEDTTETGLKSDVLTLTFKDVGVTPQNNYPIWVDIESNLVRQWAYFPNAADSVPRFVLPWNEYEQKGKILLSGDRGERDLTEIEVLENVPESVFLSFEETM